MVTFRSNNRRAQFRTNNNRRPSFRRNNDDGSKFSNNDNFQRKVPGRNNHNAPKLIEKYNDLAREALANEDKILSENYFQHADHFARILKEQESNRIAKSTTSSVETGKLNKIEEMPKKTETIKDVSSELEVEKTDKISEKETATN
jgi:hypothetical protein